MATPCTCKSQENNGYHCEHNNWIKSEFAKRGYKRLVPLPRPKTCKECQFENGEHTRSCSLYNTQSNDQKKTKKRA